MAKAARDMFILDARPCDDFMGPAAASCSCRPQRRLDEIQAMLCRAATLPRRIVSGLSTSSWLKPATWSLDAHAAVQGTAPPPPACSLWGLGCADTYNPLPELTLRALPGLSTPATPKAQRCHLAVCPQPRWGVWVKSQARSFPARSLHESCHLVYRRPRRPAQKQLRHLPCVAHGGGAKAQPLGRRGVRRRRRKRRRSPRQHNVVAAMPAPPPWQDVKLEAVAIALAIAGCDPAGAWVGAVGRVWRASVKYSAELATRGRCRHFGLSSANIHIATSCAWGRKPRGCLSARDPFRVYSTHRSASPCSLPNPTTVRCGACGSSATASAPAALRCCCCCCPPACPPACQ